MGTLRSDKDGYTIACPECNVGFIDGECVVCRAERD